MGSVHGSSREQFEQRMRARRVATCLAIARSAIASGRLPEAVERLEEACSLDPDQAEPRLLLEDLRSRNTSNEHQAEQPISGRPRHSEISAWSHWFAAAIAICVLAALAFLWPPSRPSTGAGPTVPPRQEQPSLPQRDAPAAATSQPGNLPVPPVEAPLVGTAGTGQPPSTDAAAAPAPTGASAPPSPAPREAEVVTKPLPIVPSGAETSPQQPPASPASQPEAGQAAAAGASRATDPSSSAPAGSASATMPASASVTPRAPASPPLPPLETMTVMADDLAKQVPSEAVSPAPLSAPATTMRKDDVAEADLHSSVDPSDEIADTLRRYAEAYTRLDAGAAHAVWPTVDERALARAFDGLASQRLVFDHCDVTVKGPDATAACRGRAGYVPKVGSREPLVEQRQWSFRLRRADSGWQIVQAEAR